MADAKTGPSILVVDDMPTNLRLLEGMLRKHGYNVRPFAKGSLALAAAKNDPPDLILLDVNMPEMDGYEVCRVLKSDEKLSGIPVIFISALGDTLDKVKAFEAGGVDYVTKPFQFQEVRARIETHLRLRRLQDELKEQNLQLEQTCKQLRELEVLRDNLTHMIVHDLRSPLSGVKGYLELIRAEEAKLSEQHRDYVGRALSSTSVLLKMIQDLLDVSRLEARKMPLEIRETDLGAVAHRASESLGALTRRHKVVLDLPQDPVVALCDPQVIERVVANLLGNALKFAPPDGEIQVTVAREPPEARVAVRDSEEARVSVRDSEEARVAVRDSEEARASVRDSEEARVSVRDSEEARASVRDSEEARASVRDCGPGIPPEYHQRIFEKFGQVQMRDTDRGASAGLGLTFCKLAVEAHHGKIGVESNVGAGSTFWFTLPLA